MPIFKLDKLVRDGIVDHQLSLGQKPEFRILNPQEHRRALLRKLVEEVQEISNSDTKEAAGELADVQQALDDLVKLYGLTKREVAVAQERKAKKSGAFVKGVFIETLETDENDPWTEYYRKDPERFPEIG